jgi:predicted transcriptional regulator
LQQKTIPCVAEDIFSTLADKLSVDILTLAYTGLRSTSKGLTDQSKKQYYVRLKRLTNMGLIEKDRSIYKLTTLGSLIYENHFNTMEKLLHNYWQIKSIDVLRNRNDFPPEKKESIMNEYIASTGLHGSVNATQLTAYNTINRFKQLIPEVMKVLDNAENEVYFATRYYDPHVSNLVFQKFSKGVTIRILDGNPGQISVENRLAAIIRTPPNRETAEMVKKILKSSRFDLKTLPSLPLSFIIVDGIQLVYETVNFPNPDQFTVAVSKYDDPYFAKRFIEYFNLLSKDSSTPELLVQHRSKQASKLTKQN